MKTLCTEIKKKFQKNFFSNWTMFVINRLFTIVFFSIQFFSDWTASVGHVFQTFLNISALFEKIQMM